MMVEEISFIFRWDVLVPCSVRFVLVGKDGVNFNLFCLFFGVSELSSQHSMALTLFIGLW